MLSAQRDSGFRMRKRAHDLSYGLAPDDDEEDEDDWGDEGGGGGTTGDDDEDEYAYGGGGGAADPFEEAQAALASAMEMSEQFNLPGTPDGPSRTVDPSPRARKLQEQVDGGGYGESDEAEETENTEEAEARAWAEMEEEEG